MYLTAIKTESALKNIQAKTVKPKVKDICKNSLTVGRYFPLATVSRFFLLFLVNKIGKKYKVNSEKDLVPVCPNCHAVIHFGGETLSLDEAKRVLSPDNGA